MKIEKFHFFDFWWTVKMGKQLKLPNLLWKNIYPYIEVALIHCLCIKLIQLIWKRRKKQMNLFSPFLRILNFGTLGIEIVKIWLQIRTRRPRIRLYVNFGKFGCIISLKNNQLACFFGHPVILKFNFYCNLFNAEQKINVIGSRSTAKEDIGFLLS